MKVPEESVIKRRQKTQPLDDSMTLPTPRKVLVHNAALSFQMEIGATWRGMVTPPLPGTEGPTQEPSARELAHI